MRVVALEEHYSVPELVAKIDPAALAKRGFRKRTPVQNGPNPAELLVEMGERRLGSMDEHGITVQVLSLNGPGPDLVAGQAGVDLAKAFNDHLAGVIARKPDRYAGFAALPTLSPDAAATELKRCVNEHGFVGGYVNGTTDGKFLDDPMYEPLLAAAVEIDVPIYIHPNISTDPVRNAYYSQLPGNSGAVLESAGWGWHSEVAIHVLRLVLSGALDKNPKLKLIIGHMGEMLPVMLARIDDVFQRDNKHLSRPISQTILDQVWLTTSGIFTEVPMQAALATWGIDKIMFSVDYPYAPNVKGRQFLDKLKLSAEDMAKLAHGNADKLLKLKTGGA